jgi:RNA polymerase sigma-70 factor, ECF subfamily
MHDSVDEQILIQRALDDRDAFQDLYYRYVRRVYGYVASRISHRQDAEDVVSEVFLRVIKNPDQLRQRQQTSFAAWLFVIARHAIADHYRKNGHSEEHISLDAAEPSAPAEKQPDHIFSENEEAARLYRMILSLSERKREIITLRYYGGLRNQEIATVLRIGEKTVSAYLSRALNDLQEKYHAAQSAEGHTSDE